MTGLTLGPGLELPLEAVTETFAILAKRGSGKTYTAKVLVEEMLGAGLPVCVVDPVGVWWGLRSSADGEAEGEQVVIFGGDHADVPLEATAGQLLADLVVDERVPAVLDLSGLSKSAARRFMADFAERLYSRNREPLHLVLDEADAFAPQRTAAEGARLLGAVEDLVRRGRARGIGVTLITQRPAVLNKDVLTQAEVLIALRMTGPRDVAAIDDWVRLHADDEQAAEVKASLPSLPVGTAWVWSPGWLGVLQRVDVRRARTFDSSATPRPGEERVVPRRMADVDLAALGERIAATVERAKADDPAALRARIRDLERQAAVVPEPRVEYVEVPVLADDLVVRLEGVLGDLRKHGQQAVDVAQDMLDQLHRWAPGAAPEAPALASLVGTLPDLTGGQSPQEWLADQRAGPAATGTPIRGGAGPASPVREGATGAHAPGKPAPTTGGETQGAGAPGAPAGPLPKAQRAVLTALAQHGRRPAVQLALLTGYSHRSGGFRNALSSLRTAGLIEGRGDDIEVTPAGLQALGAYEPLPTGPALLDWWQHTHLGKAERAVVEVLAVHYPRSVPVEEIAAATGYSPTSGGFRNALSRLRSLELAAGRGALQLSPTLGDPLLPQGGGERR